MHPKLFFHAFSRPRINSPQWPATQDVEVAILSQLEKATSTSCVAGSSCQMLILYLYLVPPAVVNTSVLSITHKLHQPGGTGYIDVHNDDPAQSRKSTDYDVLLIDIDGKFLQTEISQRLRITYLSTPEASDIKPVKEASGYIHGIYRRMI